MIITLTKADFSSCKIGTLTTFNVRKSTTIGATVNIIKTSVERAGYSSATTIATIVLDEANYEGHAIKVMMGSTDVSSWYSVGNVIVPANTPITSNITISVSATAIVPDVPVIPDEPDTPTMYTFTINPTPSNATVTLTATGYAQSGNSIEVPSGTSVAWKVSASGYTEQNGTEIIKSTLSKSIILDEITIVNLYNKAAYPANICSYQNTPSVLGTNKTILLPNHVTTNTETSLQSGVEVFQMPIESGKTYSIKLYNAPTTITSNTYQENEGKEVPYYGICGLWFFETISGKPSYRYSATNSGTKNTMYSYWSTSKPLAYEGALDYPETIDLSVFALTSECNSDKVIIKNLTSNAQTNEQVSSIFKPSSSNYTQSVQFTINDPAITHMTVLFGNPDDSRYQTMNNGALGQLSLEQRATAIKTVEDGLVIVEGTKLPDNYISFN